MQKTLCDTIVVVILRAYIILGGKMDDLYTFLEQLFYDSRPVIYAALAFYSFVNKDTTPILMYSGLILSVCSLYVMNKRYTGGRGGRIVMNIK